MELKLRDYQKEALDAIQAQPPGAYLISLATGLGKTYLASQIPFNGRMLWLSHREELVIQPRKYFDCSFGIERAQYHSNGEEVVSGSIQTMVKRYRQFKPDEFDVIVGDEIHHAGSRTYREILNYFKPRLLIGITATPNRADHVRLDDIFSKIIFQRDLRWGIEHGYLCDIYARRVNIGYDVSHVRRQGGDFAPGELDEAMKGTADAIAQAYRELATGQTLIFAASVHHAQEIAARIPGAVVITGKTENRAEIIQSFADKKIRCIVNVMVFTEGTDIPCIETVIMARPTTSDVLYQQATGRGLRLYPGKKQLNLIDCVGVTGKASLCTAPSLLGIDLDAVPESRRSEIEGELFTLPAKIARASDTPESWIKNVEIVNIWAKGQKYQTHNIAFFRQVDGSLTVSVPSRTYKIPCPNALGQVQWQDGTTHTMQESLDRLYAILEKEHGEERAIWDLNASRGWFGKPVTDGQKNWITRRLKNFDMDMERINRGQASQIINRLKYKPRMAAVTI